MGIPTKAEAPKELKLHADIQTKVSIAKDNVVGDFGLVVFYGQSTVPISEFVVSHPIGQTDLPDTTFVVNRLKDVRILKNRVADPEAKRIRDKREQFKLEVLVEAKILEEKGGQHQLTYLTPFPGRVFGEAYKEASHKRMEAQEAHKQRVSKMKLKRGQKKPSFDKKTEDFYSPEEFKLRTQIDAALAAKNYEDEAVKRFPSKHRTLLDDDVPQKEVRLPGTILGSLTTTQTMDRIQAETWKFLTGKVTETDRKANEDLLRKEIHELQKEKLRMTQQHASEIKNLENRDAIILAKNHELADLTSQLEEARKRIQELEEQVDHLTDQQDQEEPEPSPL